MSALAEARSITLSDGTSLADLFDVENRRVSMRAFWDPEIYELEIERLFTRGWVAVGHESEIPRTGDYITRFVGEDPIIVSRDKSGAINVLLNSCMHRGLPVCREDVGNGSRFQCPFHGWTYDLTGELKGVPFESELYPEPIDRECHSLRRARVADYVGVIFATFDEDAPPLEEVIAPFALVLDLTMGRTEGGMEVLGPPIRTVIPSNWKFPQLNDVYHVATLHKSLHDIGLGPSGREYLTSAKFDVFAPYAKDYNDIVTRNGVLPPGLTPEMFENFKKAMTPEQRAVFDATAVGPGGSGAFPNLRGLHVSMPRLDGRLGAAQSIRIFNPVGVDQFESLNYVLIDREAPEEMRESILEATTQNVGPSSVYEVDDSENWVETQRALRGRMARQGWMHYGATSAEAGQPATLGEFFERSLFSDDSLWMFWLVWLESMTR